MLEIYPRNRNGSLGLYRRSNGEQNVNAPEHVRHRQYLLHHCICTWISSVSVDFRKFLVIQKILYVRHFVVYGYEIFHRNVSTHFYPRKIRTMKIQTFCTFFFSIRILYVPIIDSITEIPRRRLTDNRSSGNLFENRFTPKFWRHSAHVHRHEEFFGNSIHRFWRVSLESN